MIPAGPRAGGKGGDRGGPARRGRCCSSGPPPVAPRGPDPAAAQARSSPCLRPGAARPRSRPGPGAFPGGSRVGLKPPSPSDPQPGWGCCTSIPLRDQRPPPPCTFAISKRLAESKEGSGKGCSPPSTQPSPAQRGPEGAEPHQGGGTVQGKTCIKVTAKQAASPPRSSLGWGAVTPLGGSGGGTPSRGDVGVPAESSPARRGLTSCSTAARSRPHGTPTSLSPGRKDWQAHTPKPLPPMITIRDLFNCENNCN